MGIKRGSFESVAPTTQVAGPRKHSTIRPDEGQALRYGADALKSWADHFSKMGDMCVAAGKQKSANMEQMQSSAAALRQAAQMGMDKTDPDGYKSLQNKFENDVYNYNHQTLFGVWGTAPHAAPISSEQKVGD